MAGDPKKLWTCVPNPQRDNWVQGGMRAYVPSFDQAAAKAAKRHKTRARSA